MVQLPDAGAEEQFETFTETGELMGRAPRSRVHALGLWHKSVHVFLFDGRGRLYLQRRSAAKDVCPGLWDLSAAEHLRPGETYEAGAYRGLAEELGVAGVTLTQLGGPVPGRLELPALGIRDFELQQAFRASWKGALHPDPVEVAEIRALERPTLAAWVRDAPIDFTPWFLREVVRCGILPPP